MNHTPGPWKLGSDHQLLIEGQNTRKPIAEVLANFPSKEVHANARLIAASPLLLAAAKIVLNGGIDAGLSWNATLDVLKAAIAKAEGQSGGHP